MVPGMSKKHSSMETEMKVVKEKEIVHEDDDRDYAKKVLQMQVWHLVLSVPLSAQLLSGVDVGGLVVVLALLKM